MSARGAWVLAVACGAFAACGGRSVDHDADSAGSGGSGADEPGAGGTGTTSGSGGGGSGTSTGSGGTDQGGLASGGAGGTVSGKGGSGGTFGSGVGGSGAAGGGAVAGTGGGKGFGLGGKAFALVRSACAQFCQNLPTSCAMTETDSDCERDCIYAGTDSPSCAVQFAGFVNCMAGHLYRDVSCDESCSGNEGCAGEAIATCETEQARWESCVEECGTTTKDYELGAGCRRSSACNDYVTECAPSADFSAWECTCFNIHPNDVTLSVPTASDECLAATRKCWGL